MGLALILGWFGLHSTDGPALLIAAGLVLAWALVRVPRRLHRVGLVVVATAVAAIPLVTGDLGNVTVLLPCLITVAGLIRCALVREPVPLAPADPDARLVDAARSMGRFAGRAGKVVEQADTAVPRGARTAGRLVARLRSRDSR